MNNSLKEIKAIAILALIAGLLFGFIFVVNYYKIDNYFYFSLLGYMVICLVFTIAGLLIKSQIVSKVVSVVLFPAMAMLVLGTVILPFGFLFIHLITYIALALAIPEGFFLTCKFFEIEIVKEPTTILYIKLTSIAFIAVMFNYLLRKLVYLISPARLKTSKKLKPYELDKLTDYLLSEQNVRFLIYGLYVLLLFTINVNNFESMAYSTSLNNDKAILQSFVIFIAFDRALILLKQLEFKPSDFLAKITQSIINKFKDLEDKNHEQSDA